jgi:hypothetical protein
MGEEAVAVRGDVPRFEVGHPDGFYGGGVEACEVEGWEGLATCSFWNPYRAIIVAE